MSSQFRTDTFLLVKHYIPQQTANGDTGDVADDHYHHVEKDVALLKRMGVKAYRFSLAWPRIIPGGIGEVNEKGLAFYDRLIDLLLTNEIEPFVTLFHWDLPAAFQESHGGFLTRDFIEAYEVYAKVCFDRFGDRVKHWITFNEPWCSAVLGHGVPKSFTGDVHAPGRQDAVGTEPYLVGHHILLAHARAVKAYRAGVRL